MKKVSSCRRVGRCQACDFGISRKVHHPQWVHARFLESQGKEDEEMPIKRRDVSPGSGGAHAPARRGDDWVLRPSIMEFLAEDRYEDGSARRTGTINLFVQDGQVKGCINDRDTNQNSFVSAESIEELLAVIEAKLSSSSVEWRDAGGKSTRRK